MAQEMTRKQIEKLISDNKAIDTSNWTNTEVGEKINIFGYCKDENGQTTGIVTRGSSTGKLYVYFE